MTLNWRPKHLIQKKNLPKKSTDVFCMTIILVKPVLTWWSWTCWWGRGRGWPAGRSSPAPRPGHGVLWFMAILIMRWMMTNLLVFEVFGGPPTVTLLKKPVCPGPSTMHCIMMSSLVKLQKVRDCCFVDCRLGRSQGLEGMGPWGAGWPHRDNRNSYQMYQVVGGYDWNRKLQMCNMTDDESAVNGNECKWW